MSGLLIYNQLMDKEKRLTELSEEEKYVTQEKGTEAPFSNKYWNHHEGGDYLCKVCGVVLFKSDAKFDSGTGWPSFDRASEDGAVLFQEDTSHGMSRVEAICKNCGAHLGHVFNDGPKETTGMRDCINSASLDFKKGE